MTSRIPMPRIATSQIYGIADPGPCSGCEYVQHCAGRGDGLGEDSCLAYRQYDSYSRHEKTASRVPERLAFRAILAKAG